MHGMYDLDNNIRGAATHKPSHELDLYRERYVGNLSKESQRSDVVG